MTFTFVSEGAEESSATRPPTGSPTPTSGPTACTPRTASASWSGSSASPQDGGTFDEEYRFRASDGGYVWLRDLGHAVRDVNGVPVLIRGLMVEITERKAIEAGAIEAEHRFRRVVEHLPGDRLPRGGRARRRRARARCST